MKNQSASAVSALYRHSPLIILFALVTFFWWPALWHEQIILHQDAGHFSQSLLIWQHQSLFSGRELLWDSGIYGGHPLFAESQGGFANPLNILCAFLFDPLYGMGVLHWLSMLLSGLGAYCLAQCLGIRVWPALFASLAVVFSGSWIEFQYNATVTGALTWLPWFLASVEYWLQKPTLRRSVLMAIAAALMIFAGYPHIAYGAAIYVVVQLIALVAQSSTRRELWAVRRDFIRFGSVAVVLAIGLAAVQLLPLLELISQSHRKDGVTLPFAGLIPLSSYFKSLLIFNTDPKNSTMIIGNLGSGLTAMLAVAVIFAKLNPRVFAHVLAAIALFNLGIEYQSPLFKLVYELKLIPGLNSFRIMHPFFPLAIIGLAIAAAYVLDNFAAITQRIAQSKTLRLCVGAYMLLCIALVIYYYDPILSVFNQVEALIFIALAGALILCRKNRLIPVLAVVLYAAGVLLYRTAMFDFYDRSALTPPSTIGSVHQDPDYKDFKSTVVLDAGVFAIMPPNEPKLEKHYQRFLSSLAPFPTITLGIASIDGTLGLPLARRMLSQKYIEAEITGGSSSEAGSRLIDVLGVKYIPLNTPSTTPGLELRHHDESNGIYLYYNTYAKPRLQLYPQATFVDSTETALAELTQSKPGTLILESKTAVDNTSAQPCLKDAATADFELLKATSMHYQVRVSSECPVWLFLADANFPGWQASVDDNPAELYSAQVLGKAVHVPAGEHTIKIDYVPKSFYIGLLATVLSLFIAGLAWLLAKRRSTQA
jgi:hypothetical protein